MEWCFTREKPEKGHDGLKSVTAKCCRALPPLKKWTLTIQQYVLSQVSFCRRYNFVKFIFQCRIYKKSNVISYISERNDYYHNIFNT